MNTNRDIWIDYAKAIVIILVVYVHIIKGLINANIILEPSIYLSIDQILYSCLMPLFFFVSGIYFYQSFIKRGFKKFVFKKFDKIVIPYIIFLLFKD